MSVLLDRIRRRTTNLECATDMAKWHQPVMYPPTSLNTIKAVEAKLGMHLPALLLDMYTHIGNGGFGPGYGLLGVEGSPHASEYAWDPDLGKLGLLGTYNEWASYEHHPKQLIPICHWGCGLWSCIDASLRTAPVVYVGGAGGAYVIHSVSFEEWITAWVAGVDLFERGNHAQQAWVPQIAE